MLTINDNGDLKKFPLDVSKTIQQNIELHIDGGAECALAINGQIIETPATDDRLMMLATVADDVVLFVRPEGNIINLAGEFSLYLITGQFIPGVGSSISQLFRPQPPTASAAWGNTNSSPNNSLTGQSNRARAYEARPDICGQVKSYPDLIGYSEVKYVNNIKTITEFFDVGRGKCPPEQLKDTDTLLSSIQGASSETFYPVSGPDGYYESGTTTVTNQYQVYPTNNIDGQTLPPAVVYPVVEAPYSTTINTIPDSTGNITVSVVMGPVYGSIIESFNNNLEIVLTMDCTSTENPSFSVDESVSIVSFTEDSGRYIFVFSRPTILNGKTSVFVTSSVFMNPINYGLTTIGPYFLSNESTIIRINYAFLRGLRGPSVIVCTYWQVDSNDVEIPFTRNTHTDVFNANTYDQQFRTVDFNVPLGRYAVQFARTNTGSDDATQTKIEEAFAVQYFATKAYPGDTILKITRVANSSATSGSESKINCIATRWQRGLRTAVQTASRSFARAVVNQYVVIAGEPIDDIDIDALEDIEASLPEELARFDFTFDDKNVSLGDRLKVICNAARVQCFRDGSKWSFARDEEKSGAVMQLDYRNISSSGESSVSFNSVVPSSFDGIQLGYVNPTTNKASYYNVKIQSDGSVVDGLASRPRKDQLSGCRTVAQARNRAYLEAAKLVYQRQTLQETGMSDCLTLNKLDVLRWVDPNDFYADDGLYAGEVLSIAGRVFTTSEPIQFGSDSGRVFITRADGFPMGPYVCSSRTDDKNGFVLAIDPPTEVYTASGETQLGSRYSVGVGLTEQEINESGLYSVIEVKPAVSGDVSLSLVQYDNRVFQYD